MHSSIRSIIDSKFKGLGNLKRQIELIPELGYREKRELLVKIQNLTRGVHVFTRLGDKIENMPTLLEWQEACFFNPKKQATWVLDNTPERGEGRYKIFTRLLQAFAFSGQEYYYWKRIISKERNKIVATSDLVSKLAR